MTVVVHRMKYGLTISIVTILITFMGCSKPQKSLEHSENKQNNLTFEDIPNKTTVYEVIQTQAIDESDAVLDALKKRLATNQFEFIETDNGASWSENDCSLNKIIQVKGNGIRSYKAISKVKLGNDKKYQPDFVILIFGFENDVIAEKNYKTLASAVNSFGGYCNGKVPENIVRNGKDVFYLTTRAEMFRAYIDDYAKFIHEF